MDNDNPVLTLSVVPVILSFISLIIVVFGGLWGVMKHMLAKIESVERSSTTERHALSNSVANQLAGVQLEVKGIQASAATRLELQAMESRLNASNAVLSQKVDRLNENVAGMLVKLNMRDGQ